MSWGLSTLRNPVKTSSPRQPLSPSCGPPGLRDLLSSSKPQFLPYPLPPSSRPMEPQPVLSAQGLCTVDHPAWHSSVTW